MISPGIPLQAWAPYSDPTLPGVLMDVNNLIPTDRGWASDYGQLESLLFTAAVPDAVKGGETIETSAGLRYTFLATATNLFRHDASTCTTVSRGTIYASATPDYDWQFTSFGDVAIAVQKDNRVQFTTSPGANNFADLTAAPIAATVASARNFLIVANTTGNSTYAYGDAWWCSKIEDYTNWTPDIATQSARGRLTATPGRIVRLMPWSDYVLAFKNRSIFRGTYVGAAQNTFEWPVITRSFGAAGPFSVVEVEGAVYGLGVDGFWRFDGASVQRIPNAPNQWLRANCWDFSRFRAIWDGSRRVVRWYAQGLTADYRYTLGLSYHVDTGRWGKFDVAADWALNLTADAAPTVNGYSGTYTGAAAVISGVNRKVNVYGNTLVTSTITTGDIGDDDKVTMLSTVRARFLESRQPTGSVVLHQTRMNLSDPLTSVATSTRANGKYDVSHGARWHRVRFTQSGIYEVGAIQVEAESAGRR